MRAHQDVLDGKVTVDVPGFRLSEGVWLGEGTEVDPDATIGEGLRIHLHPDRIFHGAVDLHLRYAFDHRNALRDQRLGVFVNLRQ